MTGNKTHIVGHYKVHNAPRRVYMHQYLCYDASHGHQQQSDRGDQQ